MLRCYQDYTLFALSFFFSFVFCSLLRCTCLGGLSDVKLLMLYSSCDGIWIGLVWWLCLFKTALGLCKVFSRKEMAVNHLYPGISYRDVLIRIYTYYIHKT
ncbi:hypothetical protein M441DRAFT_381261 [Trichoderma asperellum CBS 433.97]|uniref:Uncharacterized protein n=1 Tax=Trichoderma asperellum (strain ATCC 204424 / CBS 433.97 / NBRC 101777) TaxID=1042311 RepID=A0A2T3ZB43_TRIA4|nr:hypothetical protein M441DRAFT_381261 [Trichoderma asperellum CBS 433.97]PTB42031.1 hypothetical protein M441DRAFT_381261 [Trichoderma asperellum CBS 433.97]